MPLRCPTLLSTVPQRYSKHDSGTRLCSDTSYVSVFYVTLICYQYPEGEWEGNKDAEKVLKKKSVVYVVCFSALY